MENKKEQILKKIREANPELMKLESNCRLFDKESEKYARIIGNSLYFGNDGDYEFNIVIFEDKAKDMLMWQDNSDTLFTKDYKDGIPVDFEILGKDPTLQDLLLTIGMKRQDIFIDGTGCWITIDKDTDDLISMAMNKAYNLSKSLIQNLENEELVLFIYNIICKEE